jgi:hypothetical protein
MNACGLLLLCPATPVLLLLNPLLMVKPLLLTRLTNMPLDALFLLLLPTTNPWLLPLCTLTMSSWILTKDADLPKILMNI